MRALASSLLLLVLFACRPASAQTQPPLAPGAEPKGTQKPVQHYYAQDGGARESVLESIVIPPKTKAPFSLILETEWVRVLADGGAITTENRRRIARDSRGRIYQERWLLVPKNGKIESQMTTIQISDPNKHTHINCFVLDGAHQCVMGSYAPSPDAIFSFQGPPTGPLPNDAGDAIHEDLGKQFVAGVETTGTRDTVIYNPGMFGNDRKVTFEREFWYSPQLGINLLSKLSDPRIGKQTFTATNLILSEPDSKLFEIPDGYTLVDRRETLPPQN